MSLIIKGLELHAVIDKGGVGALTVAIATDMPVKGHALYDRHCTYLRHVQGENSAIKKDTTIYEGINPKSPQK